MTYSVWQHWDPLRVCVVGRCYAPEFFSQVTNHRIRDFLETIAIETEEDLQKIINLLESFGVLVLRPDISHDIDMQEQCPKPPITPRDHMVMIGSKFYESWSTNFSQTFYNDIKDPSWPACTNWDQFETLPAHIQQECQLVHGFPWRANSRTEYDRIFQMLVNQGNTVASGLLWVNGAMVARIGRDLFFGTDSHGVDLEKMHQAINKEFVLTRNHVINTGGHSDATYCPVCPGLIISTYDIDSYDITFPGWEVCYIEPSNLYQHRGFASLAKINKGRWWTPGLQIDNDMIDFVEQYLTNWVGRVIETVFDVNMLIVDPQNVIVFNENPKLFKALDRYGITPHVVNFRHRFFWDGGIHCLTVDLDRRGTMTDYFV